jgi:hypothetical protein
MAGMPSSFCDHKIIASRERERERERVPSGYNSSVVF